MLRDRYFGFPGTKPETTKRNETKRPKRPKRPKRNHRHHRNETTETSETTETKTVIKYMKKFKLSRYYGSLISYPDPPVWHRDITNSRLVSLQSVLNLSATVDRIAPFLKENLEQLHDADDT